MRKTQTEYSIYFAWTPSNLRAYGKPRIVLSPTQDKWNDFTHRTNFTCALVDAKVIQFTTNIHLSFLETKETAVDVVRNILQRTSPFESTELPPFYTIQRSLEEYRKIRNILGSEKTFEFLRAINDLVALKTGKLPDWFQEATTSEPFELSFMRNSQTFFAYHNAAYVLKGTEHKEESGISKSLKLKFKLPSFENFHEIDFSFEHEGKVSKRIAVVIGENGVGKSQALANLAKSLLSGDKRLRDARDQRPLVNRLIAISSPGETRGTFPPNRPISQIPYLKVILGGERSGRGQSGFGEILVQLARSEEQVRKQERWDLFARAISSIAKLDEVYVERRRNPPDREVLETPIPLSRFQSLSEQARLELLARVSPNSKLYRYINGDLFPLSSGESTFIRFAAQACLYIENGSLLLFDEPETHLHPNLITNFVALLDNLLKMTSSFAILATHSAYFVREVPSAQVIILKQPQRGMIEVIPPRLKTLGADIGAISFFVFGDALYGRLMTDLGKRLSKSSKNPDLLLSQIETELSDEAYMYLRRKVEDSE